MQDRRVVNLIKTRYPAIYGRPLPPGVRQMKLSRAAHMACNFVPESMVVSMISAIEAL